MREPDAYRIVRAQIKDVCEMMAGSVNPALDRAHGRMLTGGDFLIAHAIRTKQQKNLALPLRQFRQSLSEILQFPPTQLIREGDQAGDIGPFALLDLPLPLLRIEIVLHDRKKPGLDASSRLEPVAPVTDPQERALHEILRAVHVMGERDRNGTQMTSGIQEVLDETWIMPILENPDGTLEASDQPDEIQRQIGRDEVGIDATQLLSQVLSDRIAENNEVGCPELGASHKENMLSDLCRINRRACGKLTQFLK
jgi:hypothetical protein